MSRVQRPTVVRSYELPMLFGKPPLHRVLLDVRNRSADIVGVFEEDYPTWTTPYRMIVGPAFSIAKPQAADGLEILNHILRLLPVLANQEVNVIRHNRASIASVDLPANTLGEGTCDNIHVVARNFRIGNFSTSFARSRKLLIIQPAGCTGLRP